ncbi:MULTISPECIES: hypothetical protein [unclassified Bradyrhizobium]|uniref:hypothetical protein n=1 Tax=unclassified Bradyrhizobium TaxID=2631580 RepID=UPI001FF93116|nr:MULTISPECIES: hypothetical protein [unclassified Bradyrhizobium]MCK1606504.1 hypothetical protein [Bradyrhizobium sp. 166]MCK1671703.1 hypothetical protein [Bradyrhizobium sp. 150]
MNSLAVALAADSAATVSDGHDNKVYNSANKLFMLSKHHPVGVMVYNNSSLLGIPWETILKMFRDDLGATEFDTLEEYGSQLIKFLDGNTYLFPEHVQHKSYLNLVETLYQGIFDAIQKEWEQKFLQLGPDQELKESDLAEIGKSVILNALNEWNSKPDADCFPDKNIGSRLSGRLSGEIHNSIAKIFGKQALDAQATTALREIAKLVVSKDDILIESHSGLVVAGFGKKDYFPVMQIFELGEVFCDKLKHRKPRVEKISSENPSIVKPFAHSEMVDTFLRGVNSVFELRMVEEIVNLVVRFPNEVIDAITDLTSVQKELWKEKVLSNSAEPLRAFVKALEAHRIKKHRGPILQAIINLPIDELAHVAQSLVNLNSFQKRMSLGPETVGGPVDVAVISKGDGFIWIERKHYFRRELNEHFFRNYNRKSQTDPKATPPALGEANG